MTVYFKANNPRLRKDTIMGSFVRLKVEFFALFDTDLPNFHLPLKAPDDWNKTTKMAHHVPYFDYLEPVFGQNG